MPRRYPRDPFSGGRRLYYNRRKVARRMFRRYRGGKKKTSYLTLPRGPVTIMPDRYRTKLRYSDFSTTGSVPDTDIIMVGNGLFDPEVAVGGQQPNGFDQMMAIYEKYAGMACKIRVTLVNLGSTGVRYSVFPLNTATSPGTLQSALSLPFAKTGMVGNSGGSNKVTITNFITTRKMQGQPTGHFQTDDDEEGTSSANPNNAWYWHVMLESGDGVSNMNVEYQIQLTFYVEFSERTYIGVS